MKHKKIVNFFSGLHNSLSNIQNRDNSFRGQYSGYNLFYSHSLSCVAPSLPVCWKKCVSWSKWFRNWLPTCLPELIWFLHPCFHVFQLSHLIGQHLTTQDCTDSFKPLFIVLSVDTLTIIHILEMVTESTIEIISFSLSSLSTVIFCHEVFMVHGFTISHTFIISYMATNSTSFHG